MTVRTYYGNERVSVEGPNGSRLVGTVSGVAGGRVVVALDEETTFYPAGRVDEGPIPGRIAQVLEQDLEFFVDGSDVSAPSFTPEQLAYLRRTYGSAVEEITNIEASSAQAAQARTQDDDFSDDEPTPEELQAAAAEALRAQGGGLSADEIANARVPAGE